jgi:hypothetical protein
MAQEYRNVDDAYFDVLHNSSQEESKQESQSHRKRRISEMQAMSDMYSRNHEEHIRMQRLKNELNQTKIKMFKEIYEHLKRLQKLDTNFSQTEQIILNIIEYEMKILNRKPLISFHLAESVQNLLNSSKYKILEENINFFEYLEDEEYEYDDDI